MALLADLLAEAQYSCHNLPTKIMYQLVKYTTPSYNQCQICIKKICKV